jgi:hypothetical protein
MGRRKCPLCFAKVPWTAVLAQSYDFECPACRAPLEVSRYTRIAAGFGGIAGAMIAAHFAPAVFPAGVWVTGVAAAIFGYGTASAVCVFIVGDLLVRAIADRPAFPQPAK